LECQRLLAESFRNRDQCELVALHDYPLHDISRGEVLFDTRSYVNPRLERDE